MSSLLRYINISSSLTLKAIGNRYHTEMQICESNGREDIAEMSIVNWNGQIRVVITGETCSFRASYVLPVGMTEHNLWEERDPVVAVPCVFSDGEPQGQFRVVTGNCEAREKTDGEFDGLVMMYDSKTEDGFWKNVLVVRSEKIRMYNPDIQIPDVFEFWPVLSRDENFNIEHLRIIDEDGSESDALVGKTSGIPTMIIAWDAGYIVYPRRMIDDGVSWEDIAKEKFTILERRTLHDVGLSGTDEILKLREAHAE